MTTQSEHDEILKRAAANGKGEAIARQQKDENRAQFFVRDTNRLANLYAEIRREIYTASSDAYKAEYAGEMTR